MKTPSQLFEAVPNISEGRDQNKIEIFAQAILSGGAKLLDYSADADHNRSVYTLVGSSRQVQASLLALAAEVVQRVDMREHSGVHPCLGALDVLPIIPLPDASLDKAKLLARRIASLLWSELGLPSLFYDYKVDKSRLAKSRQRGFAGLAEVKFDVGDKQHPTAGAVAVSARELMIAFNVNLLGGDLSFAKKVARHLRESSGGLAGVKALGLYLPTQKKVQVSMNLTDYRKTSLGRVYRKIAALVQGSGVQLQSELIGLMPEDALTEEEYALLGLDPDKVKKI